MADGSYEAGQRLRMRLVDDPAVGVVRRADAAREKARATAHERGVDLPRTDG
ncbi:MAG TPA: hypothetical protein VFK04_00205 [Gemmatimonadaceae bacterium]|nr:hypothetical protein [Gemmatimonadaceae bacterium]